jgi:hypothetical protein
MFSWTTIFISCSKLRKPISAARCNGWESVIAAGSTVETTALARHVAWSQIIAALEEAKGERWAEFGGRHGDWGRDAALWLGRRRGRLKLAELGELAGGLDYAAVGQAVSRFGKRLANEAKLRTEIRRLEMKLSIVEV